MEHAAPDGGKETPSAECGPPARRPVQSDAPVFALRSASAKYNDHPVLDDITLTIGRGERVALVGESGAGKSTLLRLLYNSAPDSSALVTQDYGLVKALSVFHNVYMGRLQRHRTWYNLINLIRPLRREKRYVEPLLARLGMAEKMLTPVGELSGGQQQRTAVARALYQGATVLLGDEPVSALDEPHSHLVLGTIGEYYDTVVLAMHDVRLALQYSDRVVGIHMGAVAIDEKASDVTPADLTRFYAR